LRDKEVRQELTKTPFPTVTNTIKFMYSIRMSLIVIVLWQLIVRVDQFLLAAITDAYTLGIYAVAVKIAEIPNFFAGIMYTALIARVSLFAKEEDTHSKVRIRKVLITYFSIGLFFAAIIIITAPLLVHILYGAKFLEAIPVLRAYAISIPGMFLCLHYFAIYGAKDKHFHQSVIFGTGIIINSILIYVLTPIMGVVGAALATSCAYSFVALSFYLHVR
jgi:O-antigen/teichoic acid export membrane protein